MFNTKAEADKQDLLDNLKIAAPCNVSWESMDGDDRVRHCGQCTKNVYNISLMTRSEANEFLQATAHQACVNFYRRHDGTIITDNCPVGLRKLRAQYRKVASVVATLVSLLQGLFLNASAGEPGTNKNGDWLRGSLITPKPPFITQGREVVTDHEPPSVLAYREKIDTLIASTMPKEDLKYAAVTFSIDSQGHIDNIRLVHPSPKKTTDQHILKAVSAAKVPELPSDYKKPILYVYYECSQVGK